MWLHTIGLIVTLALGFLLVPLAAIAQPLAKVSRIGLLWDGSSTAAGYANRIDAFRQGLRELGYVEGQHFVMEFRFAEGRSDRYPALVAELVQLPVDIM